MTVRIFIGNDEDVKELAEETPQEASIIDDMRKAAQKDSEQEEIEAASDE